MDGSTLIPVPATGCPSLPGPRLVGRTTVLRRLRELGVSPARQAGESREEYENRVGTKLMVLYRDTRCAECFDALYAFTRGGVLHWIQGLLHRGLAHLDPAELLQDTFVNVYRYPGAFREDHEGSFRVWVRTIAGNIVRRASAPRGRGRFQELPEGVQEPEDWRRSPAVTVAAEEQEGQLRGAWMLLLAHYARAWGELSQRDRRTLYLVEVEGLSYAAAGEVLGVGRSNMKMIVFRARKRIARHIRQAMNAAVTYRGAERALRAG